MDSTDTSLIAALRRNARMSLSDLASHLGVTRTTARTRLERLSTSGIIKGFSIVLQEDIAQSPVRGLMLLGIEGRGGERITRQLQGLPEVQAIHSTNGKWDLIAEIGTHSLEALDKTLSTIRKFDGVTRSETNLLLATHHKTNTFDFPKNTSAGGSQPSK